ncbi:MAG: hypothetical protein GY828_04470, partial [Candidatus Gracilibacteria bacterium]|nr:hypothetical protein [Candidatus Gracilibacteria bacterium]
NSYLYQKYNTLRNDYRELQKDGFSQQEENQIENQIEEYTLLEQKIESLHDSIQFNVLFEEEEEKEFSNLLMHKIIDEFDITNSENNINTIIENFVKILHEIYNGDHEQSSIALHQGDIENSQFLGFSQNGQITIDNINVSFHIDNKTNTITFTLDDKDIIHAYSFSDLSANNKFSFSKESQKSEKEYKNTIENNFYNSLENGEYIPVVTFEETNSKISKTNLKGYTISHDNGADFIKVKRGDSISKLRKLLSLTKKYNYLQNKKYANRRDEGFNIKASELQANQTIPIPLDYEKKILSNEDFLYYSYQGLREMKEDVQYGKQIQELLGVMSEKEILSLALGVAKQESHLGKKALHRYEKSYKVFSYGYFHLLMDNFGKNIVKNLGLTTGQMLHPRNGTKVFLAF